MYNAAVSRRKAVVGRPGTKMPMMPMARERVPRNMNKIFFKPTDNPGQNYPNRTIIPKFVFIVQIVKAGRHGGMEAWRHGGMEAWRRGSTESSAPAVTRNTAVTRRRREQRTPAPRRPGG